MAQGQKSEVNASLKRKLRIAGIDKSPKEFMNQTLRISLFVAVIMAALSFFLFSKRGISPAFSILAGGVFFVMAYSILLKSVDAKINRRAKEIDRDVLFAGRFLLIKLNSGKPLINSLIDASQSYGVASHYFKELVRNIELGTPLENAIESAMDNCPSKKMKRVLFQMNTAQKIGVDVTQNLEAVINEISHDQLIEVQRYGKKLNSLVMFYMLLAVVMPSLGLTMFIVVASMVSLSISVSTFFTFAFFLLMIELLFMTFFKSIRPSVNI